ncbi:MAG: hypothetical protein ACRDP1_08945 [Nocardioidaceae bacterium]
MPIPTADTPVTAYLLLPAMAVVVLATLSLVLRWAHRPSGRKPAGSPARPQIGDHGLLVPVTTVRGDAAAEATLTKLRQDGIAATTSSVGSEHLVLVWRRDAAAALASLTHRR